MGDLRPDEGEMKGRTIRAGVLLSAVLGSGFVGLALLRRRKKTAAVLLLLLAAGAAVVGAAQFADANGAPSPIRVTAGKMTLDPESKVVIETSETDEAVVLILGKDAPKIETVKSTVK